MWTELYRWLPTDAIKILLTLFLSFLFGFEREERKAGDPLKYSFGGVRTFPLIGLIGYAVAFLAEGQLVPLAVGLAVVGSFLMIAYNHKLSISSLSGVTSEMSGLMTYLVGALVYREQYWVAVTLSVSVMLLLEFKAGLEGLSLKVDPEEILTFTKFLLLTAVILPVVPNRTLGPFDINPFRTWLVVVAVSTVSYGSYVLQRLTAGKGGVILAAILGGVYSSTVVTVALAKQSSREARPHLISGATLMASGVMYLRLCVLLGLFNHSLLVELGPSFVALAAFGVSIGWFWSGRPDAVRSEVQHRIEPKNPLEIGSAFLFALVFLAVVAATHAAAVYLGQTGVFTLAAVMGITDVDPFIMGITQTVGSSMALHIAAVAILIAVVSNNLVKGIYSYAWSERRTGVLSLALMTGFAVLGIAPLLWLRR